MSDLHYAPETVDEVDRCFAHAVEQAIALNCDAAVLSGDLFDHKVDLHAPCVYKLTGLVRDLANHMPVLILQGTYSHDAPGSLDIFKHLQSRHHIYVADTICQVALIARDYKYWWIELKNWGMEGLEDIKDRPADIIVSCLPSINKGQVAASIGAVEAASGVGELVYTLMKGWAVTHATARNSGIPSIVVSHGTVTGCQTEHGVPMAGLDHEFTSGTLFAADASAVMLGHIHKHQHWIDTTRPASECRMIAYPGSIGRLHYGEQGDKGFLIWDITPSGGVFTFHPTPAKRLVHYDFPGVPDMDRLRSEAETCEGAHVRIRYSIDEEHRKSVDKDEIRGLFATAKEVKIEARINPITRQRAAGISTATSTRDRLVRWCEQTKTESPKLLERLALLQEKDVDSIVEQI